MRKRDRKLRLHRETLHRLEPRDLVEAQGAVAADFGPQTSCVKPNCCGDPTIDTLGTQ